MDKLRKCIVFMADNFKIYFFSGKTLLAAAGTLYMAWLTLHPLGEYASLKGERLHALELFAHYTSGTVQMLIITMGLFLLFCDAPFLNHITRYRLIRADRLSFYMGQVLYVIAVSGLYTLWIWICTMVGAAGSFRWGGGWSRTVTVAGKNYSMTGMRMINGFTDRLVRSLTPEQAFYRAALGLFLFCIFSGLMLCAVSMLFNGMAGNAILGILIGSDYALTSIYGNGKFFYIQPLSMIKVAGQDLGSSPYSPSIGYVAVFLTVGCILFLLLGFYCSRRHGGREMDGL